MLHILSFYRFCQFIPFAVRRFVIIFYTFCGDTFCPDMFCLFKRFDNVCFVTLSVLSLNVLSLDGH
jgi:hypothetical protein